MGHDGIGYFTFSPTEAVGGLWDIQIFAPTGQGYILTCWGVKKMGLPAYPSCATTTDSGGIRLTLPAGSGLDPALNYTFGIGVKNANKVVVAMENLWSIFVRDDKGKSRMANLEVPGLTLRSLRMNFAEEVVVVGPAPKIKATSRARIDFSVDKALVVGRGPGAVLSGLRLVPPGIFVIEAEEDGSFASLSFDGLPASYAQGTLSLSFGNITLSAGTTYSISVLVRNPADITPDFFDAGFDNTWALTGVLVDAAGKNPENKLFHILAGYVCGNTTVAPIVKSSARAPGGHLGVGLLAVPLVLLGAPARS